MIDQDGHVVRERHAWWCLCDECEAEHPGKREFFSAEIVEGS